MDLCPQYLSASLDSDYGGKMSNKYDRHCTIDIDNIDEKEAWMFGFFASDGSLHKPSSNSISDVIHWTIGYKDVEVLYKIRHILNITNPVKKYKDSVVFRFADERYNIIFSKLNMKSTFPEQFMNQKLNRHYIRGLIDGDGSLHSGVHSKQCITFVNEKECIVKDFAYSIHTLLGIGFKTPKYDKKSHIWKILYQTREARLLAWYAYHGNVSEYSLQRKLNLYKKWVNGATEFEEFWNAYFGNTPRYKPISDKHGIYVPAVGGKNTDSLESCKLFQKVAQGYGYNFSIVPRNKGQKKYYGLYINNNIATNIDMLRSYLKK